MEVMGMTEFKNKEMAAWLEGAVRTMFEAEPNSIAVIARLQDGCTMTAYYHADAEQKAVFAHHITNDAVLDVVTNNIGLIRDALDELDAGGDGDES